MTPPVILRGITWDHPRGYLPLVATAQYFHTRHPSVTVTWEERSLEQFEDAPVEVLGRDYDLVVLDHPCIGRVAEAGVLLPLDQHLSADFLAAQAAQAVGASHESYAWNGHHWALAIDAAAPVACWRSDLLRQHELTHPTDWAGIVALARRGHLELPGAPVHCLMHFYMLCLAEGEAPFSVPGRVVAPSVARAALEALQELFAHCPPGCWERNPIHSLDLLARADNTTIAYCPFTYGYSNYARNGYAAHRLTFGEPPARHGRPLITVLGGAGLAVFAGRPARREALAYAEFVADAQIQRTVYTRSGGQPGHRAAWLDDENNHLTQDFFRSTLAVLDRAYVRPRFNGYFEFQAQAATVVQAALRGRTTIADTLFHLEELYHLVNVPSRLST